jgi:pyridoxine 4-dehydrogenase
MMDNRSLDDEAAGTVALGELRVRRLGFGAMRISGTRNAAGVRDRDEAARLCRRAVDRGVNFIDTANIYGYGQSEEILAEALHPYPAGLVIGTKAGYRPGKILPGHFTLPPLGDPDHIRAECDKSLKRLRADCLDLYQVHTPDPAVPYADTVGAFAELQQQGKVRHIGVSNVTLPQLELARSICTVVSVQNRCNAAERGSDDVLAACDKGGIAFLPWQPVSVRSRPVREAIAAVAAGKGTSPQQVALAWLLGRSGHMLPIPGTSSAEHLDDNVNAAWLRLSGDDYERVDAASRRMAGID